MARRFFSSSFYFLWSISSNNILLVKTSLLSGSWIFHDFYFLFKLLQRISTLYGLLSKTTERNQRAPFPFFIAASLRKRKEAARRCAHTRDMGHDGHSNVRSEMFCSGKHMGCRCAVSLVISESDRLEMLRTLESKSLIIWRKNLIRCSIIHK